MLNLFCSFFQASNSVEVCEYNGIEPLINLLSNQRETAQANAAVVLTNLATDEILRSEIQSKGVVGALIRPLQSRYLKLTHTKFTWKINI